MTDQWVQAVRDQPRIRFHTAFGKSLSCGITCVEVEGVTSTALRDWLLNQRHILTMDISRRTREFAGVRISPGLSNTPAELDQLVDALRAVARGAV